MRFDRTFAFMGVSIVFMFFALLLGAFRLMSLNLLATGIFAGLYGLHSIIMVFGFLAAIIMTERVAGVRMIPGAESFKAPGVMVPLIVLGVFGEIVGYSWQLLIVRYFGALFLAAGCLAFILTLRLLRRKTEAKVPSDFMVLSVVSLLWAAAVSAFTLPEDDMGFIMLLISFPILFILAERVELTRVVSNEKSKGRFRRAFVIASASIILFALGTAEPFSDIANLTFLIGSVLLLIVFISALITENQNLNLLLKSPRPLQHYVSRHVRVAYGWAVIGMALAVSYSLSSFKLELYDPFIHSLTVGFTDLTNLIQGRKIVRKGTERMCGHSGENETQCSVCGWLGNSRLSAPLPAVLVKLQNEHESILEQSRTLLKSVEGTTRTSHKKVTVSRNLTVRYFARLTKLVTEHQSEEEQVLIPIVDKYLGWNASESLRHEHREISAALRQLNSKLTRVNGSGQGESRRGFRSAAEFDCLARRHFSREENVIYWFASLCLSQPC